MRFIPTNISIAVNKNNIHNNGTWQHGKCNGETMGNQNGFSSGWWLGHPSEKYGPWIGMMKFPIYFWENKKWQPYHQPVIHPQRILLLGWTLSLPFPSGGVLGVHGYLSPNRKHIAGTDPSPSFGSDSDVPRFPACWCDSKAIDSWDDSVAWAKRGELGNDGRRCSEGPIEKEKPTAGWMDLTGFSI